MAREGFGHGPGALAMSAFGAYLARVRAGEIVFYGFSGAQMSADDLALHAMWRPASGHPSGRWRVVRQFLGDRGFQEFSDRRGRPILYKTREAAIRRAVRLQAAEEAELKEQAS